MKLTLFSFVLATLTLTQSALAADVQRNWAIDPVSTVSFVNDQFHPSSGSTQNNSIQNLSFEFGKNFEKYEVGPIFSYVNSNFDGNKTTTSHIGGYYRYNFTPNKVGNMTIPFARVGLTFSNNQADGSSTANGTQLRLRGGLTYFPVNDFVAIEPYFEINSRSYKSDSSYSYSGITVAGRFVVYF